MTDLFALRSEAQKLAKEYDAAERALAKPGPGTTDRTASMARCREAWKQFEEAVDRAAKAAAAH